MGHHAGTHRPAAQEVAVVSRALNDPRPLARHRPAGPDGSPDLRAILGVPAGVTDPVLDSPQLRRRINAGRYPLLVALELARELGDPRAERWARLVDANDHGDGDGRPLVR
jgi:hypothetical protein